MKIVINTILLILSYIKKIYFTIILPIEYSNYIESENKSIYITNIIEQLKKLICIKGISWNIFYISIYFESSENNKINKHQNMQLKHIPNYQILKIQE